MLYHACPMSVSLLFVLSTMFSTDSDVVEMELVIELASVTTHQKHFTFGA